MLSGFPGAGKTTVLKHARYIRRGRRIARAIDGLAATPRPAGAVTTQGSEGLRRIRVGDYRVVYTLEQATRTVLIVTIGHRRDVYRR